MPFLLFFGKSVLLKYRSELYGLLRQEPGRAFRQFSIPSDSFSSSSCSRTCPCRSGVQSIFPPMAALQAPNYLQRATAQRCHHVPSPVSVDFQLEESITLGRKLFRTEVFCMVFNALAPPRQNKIFTYRSDRA